MLNMLPKFTLIVVKTYLSVFGFVPLPAPLMLCVLTLTALYVVSAELAKKYFYARMNNRVL